MKHSNYKIINIEVNNHFITISYICETEPIQLSLYQCSYSKLDQEYNTLEYYQFCMKTEQFVEITGLYSPPLQQSIRDDLLDLSFSLGN